MVRPLLVEQWAHAASVCLRLVSPPPLASLRDGAPASRRLSRVACVCWCAGQSPTLRCAKGWGTRHPPGPFVLESRRSWHATAGEGAGRYVCDRRLEFVIRYS